MTSALRTNRSGTDAASVSDMGRRAGAVLSVGAGAIHVSAAVDHRDDEVLAGLFLICAVAQLGLGLLVWLRSSRSYLAALVLVNAAAALTWLASRTVGLDLLPGLDGVGAVGTKDALTTALEAAAVGIGVLVLVARQRPPAGVPRWTARLALPTVVVLVAGASLAGVRAGHEHGHGEAHGGTPHGDAGHEDEHEDAGHEHEGVEGTATALHSAARAASGAEHGPATGGHRHAGPCKPTAEEQRVADTFAEASRAAMEAHGWEDFTRAKADGYLPISGAEANPTGHYVNLEYVYDGRVLDPDRPEVLWYAPLPGDAKPLWASMFTVREVYEEPAPTPGGCLMGWHGHGGWQATVLRPGDPRPPAGAADLGSETCWHDGDTSPMMHVFTAQTQERWGGANQFDQGRIPSAPNLAEWDPNHPNFCDHPSSDHPVDDWGLAVEWMWEPRRARGT